MRGRNEVKSSSIALAQTMDEQELQQNKKKYKKRSNITIYVPNEYEKTNDTKPQSEN